ncbi:lytic murein transglycosylase [Amaricoccus sp.]|uniref:lytic murein transglycosylase n=1 Tax=Amaricoccus sp. TaxID=1872485 RepID=UPI001B4093FE|nr:lytic murein transglycosylase [Amaricoccus sp.]MBP7242695.1 lytic murein transglycosylase [Amaricoccus sp.]
MSRMAICAIFAAAVASGCGVSSANSPGAGEPQVSRAASNLPKPASFAEWKAQFRPRAIAAGVSPGTVDQALAGLTENPEVVRLDGAQSEFTKPIWEYLDGAVSADRVATGRAKFAQYGGTLDAIEARYGVDKEAFVAIWGMESSYGTYKGSMPVIRSLATLAYEGRRRDFAEDQLVAALRIVDAGEAAPSQLVGSWAGAMGHTQFMPTSYLTYAVDFTGDGRRDVWSADPTDALASAAHYLKQSGWVHNQPWGVEVKLPKGFDYALADQAQRRPVADWRARGVTRIDGSALPDYAPAAILAPAGARGPAFAIYDNFYVIKKYNNATSYAMGVGHLANRIGGGSTIQGAWPRHERELSRTEKIEMQERLTAKGYDTGTKDGVIGPNTISAIRAYQQARGMTPDGFATVALLQTMR